MGLFRSLAGVVRVELTSADPAAAMRLIVASGIEIKDVQAESDLVLTFDISRRMLPELNRIAQKKGAQVRIVRRKGLFWALQTLRRRPVLLVGMSLILLLNLILPSRILFVEVEGNAAIPEHLILEAAREAGICFGALRRQVRSEEMKNELLGSLPELKWAGINTYGCRAVITVGEREEEQTVEDSTLLSNIIASCDGVITDCTVSNGTALCTVGQAVTKGQVLISGYRDCGRVILATRAQGEVFALTEHELTVASPSGTYVRGQMLNRYENFSLKIGKKQIKFTKRSGISDAGCVKMYSEYCLSLPGGFELPVKLLRETVMTFALHPQTANHAEESQLSEFAVDYLRNRLVALRVADAQELLREDNNCLWLTGKYACLEMIGREKTGQIGEFHGKTD